MVQNEEQLNKEQKTGMYLRISLLLFFFMLCVALYYVVLPKFFPAVVRHNIVDPTVLLTAYYGCEDEDLRWRLRRRYMRYAGEDLTDRALEEIADSGNPQRRIRAMWLLTKSNKDKCYQPLQAIFNDSSRSQDERYTAVRVLTYIGQLEQAERHLLFQELASGHQLCLYAVMEEMAHGITKAEEAVLRTALQDVTVVDDYNMIALASTILKDDQDFLNFWKKVPTSLRYHPAAEQRLQQINNEK